MPKVLIDSYGYCLQMVSFIIYTQIMGSWLIKLIHFLSSGFPQNECQPIYVLNMTVNLHYLYKNQCIHPFGTCNYSTSYVIFKRFIETLRYLGNHHYSILLAKFGRMLSKNNYSLNSTHIKWLSIVLLLLFLSTLSKVGLK